MEAIFYLAVIATFFTSLILSLGRIVGSNEFKASHLITFLTLTNLFITTYVGVAVIISATALETPFIQMILFSLLISIVASVKALSYIPEDFDSEITATSTANNQEAEMHPVTSALPHSQSLESGTPEHGNTVPVRTKTKPVIAKSILDEITDSEGGRALVTRDETVTELADQ